MNTRFKKSGSVMLVALFFTAILTIAGGITFAVIQNRYRQVHQTASWQEALLAAESGVDIAINEIRKTLRSSPSASDAWTGWSSDPDLEDVTTPDPTAGNIYKTTDKLMREGEGGQRSWCRIIVDAPEYLRNKSDDEQWYRIRSVGVAEVPGAAVAAGEKTDLRLRKFDLRRDRRTGKDVESPQATRMIEAIVKPLGAFRLALFGVKSVNMNNHNIVVDSYDSRDPNKSTNGFYDPDPKKVQKNGDVATNGQLVEAGNAHILGDVMTNDGTVTGTANIDGDISNTFYQEVFTVKAPDITPAIWNVVTVDKKGGDIAAQANTPSNYRMSSLSLTGQMHITGAADGSPTYVQILVDNDISLSGNGAITLDPGVHVRLFVGGDADITGNGVTNPNSPLHFQLYGLDREKNADGSPKDPGEMKIAGNGGFRGTVYAPSYNVEMVGGGNTDSIYGSFVGWTVRMTGVQSVHYDEALADGGLISGYAIVSWFEDVR
jgi:hypothetical protein